MMRIAVAGLTHETQTFLLDKTPLAAFDETATRGPDILARYRGSNTSMGGFIEVLEAAGAEIVPVVIAEGGVSGTVVDAVYDKYVAEICAGLAGEADRLDGVLLALHGAMVTESRHDTETWVIKDVRRAIGYDIPIMVALDLHGNLDPAILTQANAIFGYRSSPHVDAGETGKRTARALLHSLAGKIKPVCAMAKPGLVVPSLLSATTVYPGKALIERVLEWQRKPRVIDVSFFFGFAWSNVHQLGVSAVAVTDNAPELAQVIVDDLAGLAWSMREDLTRGRNVYSVADGVAHAVARAGTATKPIVILDHADRMNETSFVLRELVRQDVQDVAFPLFWDPESVQACMQAGVGSDVELLVGGKTSPAAGGPVPVKGKVLWLGQKSYMGTGPMRRGLLMTEGPTAIVQAGGIWLQLVSRSTSLIDLDPITQYGRRAEDFKIIVTKSKTHFRAVYEEVAEEIVIVDAPAYSPVDLSVFDYTNVPRGTYPVKPGWRD